MTQRPSDTKIAIERALKLHGHHSARELCERLGISQPTLSRHLKGLGAGLLVIGRSRSRRYAWRREIDGVDAPIPVYVVGSRTTSTRHIASLFAIHHDGFWVQRHDGEPDSFTPDLPWFLHELRPSGYLGRQVQRRHPKLLGPSDIRYGSTDQVLRFLTHHGWSGTGNFVLGEAPMGLHAEHAQAPLNPVAQHDRAAIYPRLATSTLASGPAGSSAAGEQPKFLATRINEQSAVPVLVKFSPPRDSPTRQRTADLLVAEHHTLAALAHAGAPAARSQILIAQSRVFLEVERFDREGPAHRLGQISLEAAHAEFGERDCATWHQAVADLEGQRLVPPGLAARALLQHAVGRLIHNSDMHFGNLSLRLDGTRMTGLTPAYDMLPMAYAPRGGELVEVVFAPDMPPASVARRALAIAQHMWQRVADDARVSALFRAIAQRNHATLGALAELAQHLPQNPSP